MYDDIIMAVPMCMYVVPRLPAKSITMAVLVVEVVVSGSVALRCAISWHAAVRAAGIVMATSACRIRWLPNRASDRWFTDQPASQSKRCGLYRRMVERQPNKFDSN
jgi:hypothetical protein